MSATAQAPKVQAINSDVLRQEYIYREKKFHHQFTEYHASVAQARGFQCLKPTQMGMEGTLDKEDDEFKQILARQRLVPREKYAFPQTSSQEYGWDTKPLMPVVLDRRIYHPKESCDITRFLAAAPKQPKPSAAKVSEQGPK